MKARRISHQHQDRCQVVQVKEAVFTAEIEEGGEVEGEELVVDSVEKPENRAVQMRALHGEAREEVVLRENNKAPSIVSAGNDEMIETTTVTTVENPEEKVNMMMINQSGETFLEAKNP